TVAFTITKTDAVTQPTAPMKPLSSMYRILPSGTNFNSDATLIINYNESLTGGKPEGDAAICIHDYSGWTEIEGSVNTVNNTIMASISHLSDYCAMIDSSSISEGIYAKLVVARNVSYLGSVPLFTDGITAMFDSAYAPCEPVSPIPGIIVVCEQYSLTWAADLEGYTYPEMGTYVDPFIQLGENYSFNVIASGGVPALVDSVTFPSKNPYITSPAIMDTHNRAENLQVYWAEYGTGTVELILVSAEGDSSFMVETTNDGSYLIESSNLTGLSTGVYSLILNYYNRKNISAVGYDSRGFIAARVMSTTIFNLE
ncbi:MAG: hypothetical protein AB1746_11710, partial [Candidatus Zixiibacteriota bacterium]